MGTFIRDLRYGVRVLSRSATFSLGILLTLGLTIGTSTAVFSVVHAVVLRPLPFGDPDRLVWIAAVVSPGRRDAPFSLPEFLDYRDQTRTLDALVAYASYSGIVSGDGPAERLQGMRLSADAFDALGATATTGRLLVASDDEPAAPRVAVIGYSLWQRRFGADPRIAGRIIRLNNEPHEVVGVLPRHFPLPMRDIEVVVPLSPLRDPWCSVRSSTNFLRMIGLLRPGVTAEQAESELNVIGRHMRSRYPVEYATDIGVAVTPLHEQIVAGYRRSLWLLLCAVVLVLGVAIANLANLLLARSLVREQEVAVRLALGASQWAIARQLLAETTILAAAGGVAGLLLSLAARGLLVAFGPPDLPRLQETSIDIAVVGFAAALSMLAGIVFTLVPLMQFRRRGARLARSRGAAGPAATRMRAAIVVAEVAVAVLLVICAMLVARSLFRLRSVDPGFTAEDVVIARISLPRASYASREAMLGFATRFRDELRALPGVAAVGGANIAPLSGVFASVEFRIVGRPPVADRDVPEAHFRIVTEDYLPALRVPVLSGRGFSEDDAATREPVALVNRNLADTFFPEGDALGAQLLIDDNDDARRAVKIVGVVGDVRQMSIDGEPTYDLYLPLAQSHSDSQVWLANNQFWVVRGQHPDPTLLAQGIRRALERADPTVGLASVRSGEDYLLAATGARRFATSLMAGFSLSALVIALIGLYAVTTYSVAQRTHELGLRMAMGATRARIMSMIVRDAVVLLASGAAIGMAMAVPATTAMGSMLYDTPPHDAALFAAAASLFVLVGAATTSIPALRASRVDPLAALRAE